ncbi:MAG: membrane protein [Acidimicrobiales bacterium]|nr:MAG: membrane protein [Acidimicrobiales bacterium]
MLVASGGIAGAAGSGFKTEFSLPDVESRRGFELLERHFADATGGVRGTIVFRAPYPVTDPRIREPMSELFDKVEALPGLRVGSPYSPDGFYRIGGRGEDEGKIAFAEVEFPRDADFERGKEVRDFIEEELRRLSPRLRGVQVELGGQIFQSLEPPDAELIGLAFAVVILIVAFGSVIAMGLPIGTALAAIATGVSALVALSNVFEMPEFTTSMAVMIGLGVGIDYALFIVTRFREEVASGLARSEAAGAAIDTAGRAVMFAGITVVISLMGMLIMGLGFVNGLATGASMVVLISIAASLTLLPALLGLVGDRIEKTRWRGLVAASLTSVGLLGVGLGSQIAALAFPAALVVALLGSFVPVLRRHAPVRRNPPRERTFAYRWSRIIQRRPLVALMAGTLLLGVVALPVFSIRLGFSDEGNLPPETTTRRAYDLLAEGFGPGFNGPLVVVGELRSPGGLDKAVELTGEMAKLPGVQLVSPPLPDDPEAPAAVLWRVIPTSAPQDAATTDLVWRLRDFLRSADGEIRAFVTGETAVSVDFSDYLGGRLWMFLAAVLLLCFLLLMVVFRSLLVPAKAVLMNLLSIGSAYGAAVAVFQWGWLRDFLGVDSTGPIEPFVPMMLFAIVFGLSMDYEVFLLSRVKELVDRGEPNETAVADGLAATARVITAAAAIMTVVFAGFMLEAERVIKLFGFGLATAILLDATVVRMILVPSTMKLLGERNWWLPRRLDRVLPRISVE